MKYLSLEELRVIIADLKNIKDVKKFDELINQVNGNSKAIEYLWTVTDKTVKAERIVQIIEFVQSDITTIMNIIKNTEKEIIIEKIIEIMQLLKDKIYVQSVVWASIGEEVQRNKIVELVRNNPIVIKRIWECTYDNVQIEKVIEVIGLVKGDESLIMHIWNNTLKQVKKDIIVQLIEALKDNIAIVIKIWKSTHEELKIEKIAYIIEIYKDRIDIILEIWKNATPKIRLNTFIQVSQLLMKKSSKETYKGFIKEYLKIDLDYYPNGDIVLPNDLKKIIFKIEDEQKAKQIEEKIAFIINHWTEITKYLQRKKANSILNCGLEIRINGIEAILEAVNVINRPIPNSLAAEEFERTNGAEKVGVDTQYTMSPETAVLRAHKLAEKIYASTTIKHYPDFSVLDDNERIALNVLHPQDLKGILTGYDTKNCFRPNGFGDNSAKNEYSLLQYCLTTPYGGIIICKNKECNEVYMSTPFMVNGNCMMFHSYETANSKYSNVVNDLLIKAAKQAIEKSKGTIDIVFMTNMHEGRNKLITKGKIDLGKYFSFYAEEEYLKYSSMYTNLTNSNIVLAARVGAIILTGEELIKWYQEECNSNPEVLKEKLNLHFGKRNENFNFGKREIIEQLEIPKLPLINKFLNRMKELEEEIEDLSLVLQLKRIKSSKKFDEAEKEEIEIIKSILLEKGYKIDELFNVTGDQLRRKLQQNRQKQIELFSGIDIDLIADVYGINLEEELRNKAQKRITSKKTKDMKKSRIEKAKRVLLNRIRECKDEKIQQIINLQEKVIRCKISDEEFKILEEAGIDVSEYKYLIRKKDGGILREKSKTDEDSQIKQFIIRGLKDKAQKEEIVAEILFSRVTEEDIKLISKRVLRESIVGDLKAKIAFLRNKKRLEELTEEEMQDVDNEIKRYNINGLIEGIIRYDLSEEQQRIISELKDGEYQFDIENYMSKISDKKKLEKRVRMEKLAKLKAGICIGMEIQKKIERIKGRIDGGKNYNYEISKFIYGNSWYIALDEEGYIIETVINSELDENGVEKDTYNKTLSKFKRREKTEVTPEAGEEPDQ